MASYIDGIHSGVFGDVPKRKLLEFQYRVLNYKERSYEQIPKTGFSSDYVYRRIETCNGWRGGDKTP